MNRIKWAFFLLLVIISFHVKAQSPEIIFTGTGKANLISSHVEILEDKASKLNINDVIHSDSFVLNTARVPNLGVTASSFWLKFTVNNQSPESKIILEVENPLLEEVTFYKPDSNGYTFIENTKNTNFYNRSNFNQNYEFALKQLPNTSVTYYLKVHGNTQLLIPAKIGSPETIANDDLSRNILTGFYFGIMLVMFLYNIFILLSTRDKVYIYYLLYLITVTLVQLNITGFGFKYLWPSYPEFEKLTVYLFPSFTAFISIAFIKQFLNTKKFVPKLDKGFWVFIVAYAFTILNAIFGNKLLSYNLININALPLALYMIGIAAYIRVKYNYRPAMFFLIAWTTFLVSIMLFVIKDFGLLPYNLLTVSFIQIGSAVEVTLLSFALADKINIFRAEKDKSQEERLAALQENDRIVREQNVILEHKVTERTVELREANDGLSKAMTELKEAESQLVESEKMASLGQLTAGIAHEINNPINFVTSNVKPLQRDVAILLDTIENFEKLSLADVSVAEKEKQIKEYKDDIDFDYLKMEIGHLLGGIGEGASRTAEIVKGLRIFSRLDEDDLKRADINEGLDSTIVIINNLLNNRIKVVREYGNLPLVECYPGKLNQVFLNIITNAIYAINQVHVGEDMGGILTITTTASENQVVIKIADNGTGMDEQTKKKLFEPFFTTKDVGEGTGLGMSIAYNTINKHNGRILVNSELGKGTEFIIELPLRQ